MKYTNLYRNIKNPLDDDYVLEQLIETYTEDNGFYSALTKRNSKNKKNLYLPGERDRLHASIFNTWKKEMLSITKEQYEQAIKDGLYDRDIFKLLAFLKTVPDVKTYEEAQKILDANYQDKQLADAMEKYRWDSIGLYSGWTHIDARHINGKKTRRPKVEHRLYLNTEMTDVHTMSKLFIEKCTAKKLPFYFKIGEFDRRDDNIVIYSDTKNLPKFLTVLYEIEKEYPELISRCGRPPILSGLMRGWIGYSSEPLEQSGEASFNSIRAKSIENAIEEEMKSWYKKNMVAKVKQNGKEVPLQEYLCNQIVEKRLKQLSEKLKKYPNSKWIKYTAQDLSNPAFIARLNREVKAKAPLIIKSYLEGTKISTSIKTPLNGEETITITPSDIKKVLKEFTGAINANDPTFKERVKARIKQDAVRLGIDPNKYCFDKANIALLIKVEHESEKQPAKKTTQQSQETKQPPKKSTERKPTTSEETPKYHRPAGTPTHYKPMTDEEILEARRKLAEHPVFQPKQTKKQQVSEETPKYHRPAGTPTYYKPMTAEEILESQRKLAECPPVKVKRR